MSLEYHYEKPSLEKEDKKFEGVKSPTDLLTLPAPNLSRLSVLYVEKSMHSFPGSFPFPSVHHFSSLTFLDLKGCTLQSDWTGIFPSSLRHFHAHCGSHDEQVVSVNNLLRLMEGCPHIELIDIFGFPFPNWSPRTPTPDVDHIIPARHLCHFSVLSNSISDWSSLFDWIDAPHLSEIDIKFSVSPDCEVLPIYFRQHMSEVSRAELTFGHNRMTCMYSGIHTATGLSFKHVLNVSPHNEYHDQPEGQWVGVVNQITSPLAQVENLIVEYEDHTEGQWDTLVQNIPSLASLETSWLFRDGFFEALSAQTPSFSPFTTPCPRLSALRIVDHTNVDRMPPPPASTRNEYGDIIEREDEKTRYELLWTERQRECWAERRSQLLTCLEHRSSRGYRLSELTLSERWLTGWNLGALRRCVDRIESTEGQLVDFDVFVV
ncbi:hypothetical protein SISNIDRAFT_164331 [Sistotremastrum niveocremeum HHB9708]|uniref:F-box domain-containing protein n=1 Tax=Sistotremastrum niveocremeum HHB9708 TaxID=1314777 RepID=A0A164SFL1_9AGAM|nr:hypothetical protein SISNIDRAFT_164331 [Sistotremastrum niveocremeum HHB9708]